MIRPARGDDLPICQEIERDAGRAFAEIGMTRIAEDEPLPLPVMERYRDDGGAFVAVDDTDTPIGYLLAEPVDNAVHIEQVSVRLAYARRGVGRRLIDSLTADTLTLTTFRDVPWNAPYYRRLGFRDLSQNELSPGLLAIRQHEAQLGLDRWPRSAMRRRR